MLLNRIQSLSNRVPAFLPAIFLCIGIVAGYFAFSRESSLLLWGTICFAVAAGVILFFKNRAISFPLFSCALGLWLGYASIPNEMPSELNETKGILEGRVCKVTHTPDVTRIVVEGEKWTENGDTLEMAVDFKVLCTLSGYRNDIKKGSTVRINSKLLPLDQVRDVPYEPDYNRYLFIDGVMGRMSVYSRDDIQVDNSTRGFLETFLEEAHIEWNNAIINSGFNSETTDFLLAVIGGNDEFLGAGVEEEFRQTGLSHILAISGLHVGVVLMILAFLLYPLKLIRRCRTLYFILLGVLVLLYAFVTGGSPSACRAAVMCCVLLGGRILEVKVNILQSLSVAVIIILCFEPLWIFMPGFQFSVTAVAGIIAFRPLLEVIPRRYKYLRIGWNMIFLPVIAMAATLLLTIVYFHNVSLNFWLPNILVAVFIPPIIVIGFIAALLSLAGLSSVFLSGIEDLLYSFMTNGVEIVSGWFPDSRVTIFLDSVTIITIAVMIIALAWILRNYSHVRLIGWTTFGILVFLFLPLKDEAQPVSELYIPRNSRRTDVLLITEGKNYLWTSLKDSTAMEETLNEISTKYVELYKRRRTEKSPTVLTENHSDSLFTFKCNTIRLHNRLLVRIDDISDVPLNKHADVAVISEHYRGNMHEIVAALDADSIILSGAIHPSRRQKFERQLDTLHVNYRNMKERGVFWQFN